MRRWRTRVLVGLAFVFVLCGRAAALSAQSAVVLDADTGATRFAHNADAVLPMASTTKIMTAIVAIEQGDLDRVYTVKPAYIQTEGSSMYLKPGERLTIRDILREYFYENNVLYAKEMVRESKKKNSRLGENEKRIFTAIEKNISDSWPDEAALSKMKSRKLDVTRKVLILLFWPRSRDRTRTGRRSSQETRCSRICTRGSMICWLSAALRRWTRACPLTG